MKRTLATVILFFALTLGSHAQATIQHYFAGGWRYSKAPALYLRAAGDLNIQLFSDGSVRGALYFDSNPFLLDGTWWENDIYGDKITVSFSITTPDLHFFRGTIRRGFFDDYYFGSGTLRSYPAGSYAGQWQVISY